MGNDFSKRGHMNYIGIDLGTTAVKCGLYRGATPVAEFRREYPLLTAGERVEQDPALWWDIICEGIRDLVSQSGEHEIAAMAVSSQGITFLPVDGAGNALGNAISWLDHRAEEEIGMIRQSIGEDTVWKITGKPLLPCYTLPKLMWLTRHYPDLQRRADVRFLMPLEWIQFRLCGKAVTDMSMASGTMLYDVHRRAWDRRLTDLAGITPDRLPAVAEMGTCIGTVLPQVADALGLEKGTRVILGGQDQKLAALGAGLKQGVATVSLGTSSAVTFYAQDAPEGAALFALNAGTLVSETALETTGAVVRWLKNTVGFSDYAEMDREAAQAGSAGGVCFDIGFSGAGGIGGLTLGTIRGNLVYALYEGIAREIAACFSRNDRIRELRIFGGGARSGIWCDLIARETGKRTTVPQNRETAVLGAVMLASGRERAPFSDSEEI